MSSIELAGSAPTLSDAELMLAPTLLEAPDLEASPEPESPVNYDDEGLTEVTLGETQFRFDSGKQGTALCLSKRSAGTYRWSYVGELRWDGRDLRSRAIERKLLGELSLALRRYMEESVS